MNEYAMKRLKSEWLDIRRSLRLEGSFVQNSAWMFTSSGLSIGIQFLFFPVLSRIYSPEAYGLFGVFNFYTTTLGNAMTFGYNQAYVLPHTRREFAALLHLTIRISSGIALLIALTALFAGESILKAAGHDDLGHWIHLIAPVSLLMAWDRMSADWAIRNGEFRRQTIVSTSVTLFAKVFNTAYGAFITAAASGLIWTTLLQHLLRTWAYLTWVIGDTANRLTERISLTELRRVAHLYRSFPLYIYWGNVLNISSAALPAALLPVLGFGLESSGFFAYSVILLDLPIRMLGSGVASVFQQKAAELLRERPQELRRHTLRLFRTLVLLSSVFSVFIWFAGEPLYAFFFGEQWRTAGIAAEWLVICYFFRMVSSPLSVLYTILGREREYFFFQVALSALRAGSVWIGSWYTTDFIEIMILFSIANAAAYAFLNLRILAIVRFNPTAR
jgi:O-antigen/teichoic acid export membrane protein